MQFARLCRWTVVSFLLLLSLQSACAQATGNPSFGNILTMPKRVTLRRALPPAYNAHGKSVSVVVEPGVNGQVATEIQGDLEGFLTKSSSDVKVQRDHPEVLITCRPTEFTSPHVVNENTNGIQSSTLAGNIEMNFRITIEDTGRILAADRYVAQSSVQLSQTTQGSAPKTKSILGMKVQTGGPTTSKTSNLTPEQMQSLLADGAARYVASFLVSTVEDLEVPLASGGSLGEPNKLALAGLWSRDLEALEGLGSFPTPKADAFRVYNMGVANEALGYATQDLSAAMKYLSAASNDYGKAMDANPGEKQFIASQNRIKTALAQVTALIGIAKANSEQQAVQQHPAATTVAEAPKDSDPPLTDADVITMVGAHLDEANIIDTIQHAGSVHFDLSVPAQVKLSHAGVSGHVLLAMKTRARNAGAH